MQLKSEKPARGRVSLPRSRALLEVPIFYASATKYDALNIALHYIIEDEVLSRSQLSRLGDLSIAAHATHCGAWPVRVRWLAFKTSVQAAIEPPPPLLTEASTPTSTHSAD